MRAGMASKTIVRQRWFLLWVCACMAMIAAMGHASRAVNASSIADLPGNASNVVELRIDGEIEPILAEYVVNGIEQASKEHASLVLITMDTPGGLDTSMREIIQAILQSPVPVVTYVAPSGSRAASAGFFILLSADVAAMSPGTETGAASPIMAVGGQVMQIDETLRKKIVNDATAFLRSYALRRGRNTDLAVTAVTDAKAFSEKEALDGKLIDLVATSPEQLLAALDGRTITRLDGTTLKLSLPHPAIDARGMTGREKFLTRIVEPDAFFILLLVGVFGLYTEFTHPGLFAPGVVGGIALVLALIAMFHLPVNFAGLLLIVLALSLFVIEAKYPTHGILGVGGVIAMVLGALTLIRSPLTGMGVSLTTALGVAIPLAVIVVILTRAVIRSRSWKQAAGREELIGEEGEIIEPVEIASGLGMARVHGEIWRVAAPKGDGIAKGSWVRVKKVDGLTLHVELVRPPQSATT
jgi:membrane-bound serine protease (ClpP class)